MPQSCLRWRAGPGNVGAVGSGGELESRWTASSLWFVTRNADGVFVAFEVRVRARSTLYVFRVSSGSLLSPLVDPGFGTLWGRFAEFTRFINFDRRGLGLSDPLVVGGAPPLEQQVADIAAVMDAVGSDRAAFYTGADGGPVAHPVRSDVPRASQWASAEQHVCEDVPNRRLPDRVRPAAPRSIRERSARPLG